MELSLGELKQLAVLARLEIEEAELKHVGSQLGAILDYVGRLSQVDTTGIPEVEDGVANRPPRSDEAQEENVARREYLIRNFPDRVGESLRVPGVFENPKG